MVTEYNTTLLAGFLFLKCGIGCTIPHGQKGVCLSGYDEDDRSMSEKPIAKRKRVKHTLTLEERLLEASRNARDKARTLPHGKERAELLRKARESDAAAQINHWLSPSRMTPAN